MIRTLWLTKVRFFACVTCLSVVKLAALATSKVLQAPCRGWARKKGGIDNVLKTKTREQVAVSENQSVVPPSSSRAPEVPTTAGDGGTTQEKGSSKNANYPAPKPKPKPKPKSKPKACHKGQPVKEDKLLRQSKLSFAII